MIETFGQTLSGGIVTYHTSNTAYPNGVCIDPFSWT